MSVLSILAISTASVFAYVFIVGVVYQVLKPHADCHDMWHEFAAAFWPIAPLGALLYLTATKAPPFVVGLMRRERSNLPRAQVRK